ICSSAYIYDLYSFPTRRSSDLGEFQDNLSNNLKYKEGIHAFYSQYGNKFGHFTFLAGLRVEISNISIESISGGGLTEDKNYTNLFPTLHTGYELGENETIQLSY